MSAALRREEALTDEQFADLLAYLGPGDGCVAFAGMVLNIVDRARLDHAAGGDPATTLDDLLTRLERGGALLERAIGALRAGAAGAGGGVH